MVERQLSDFPKVLDGAGLAGIPSQVCAFLPGCFPRKATWATGAPVLVPGETDSGGQTPLTPSLVTVGPALGWGSGTSTHPFHVSITFPFQTLL